MRLIDADTLIHRLLNTKIVAANLFQYANAVTNMIGDAPTIEAEPVRHGRWLNKKEWHLGRWVAWLECSCCGEHDDNAEMYEMLPFGAGPSNYCPNCGAKMDGGAD